MENLKGMRVAILVDNGFERVEFTEPRDALHEAGAETKTISQQTSEVRAWEVIADGNLVSSRKPDDIPAFNREMIKLFAQHYTHKGEGKARTASRI